MRKISLTVLVATMMSTTISAQHSADHSQLETSHCLEVHPADGHAPLGVMGDHLHPEGGWMLSYRFMDMRMSGMRSGTDSLSTSQILASGSGSYMIAPVEMDMFMHMLGGMYAWNDDVTIMAMVPLVQKDMDLTRVTMGGTADFSTSTSGLGDVSLTALTSLYRGDGGHLHANLGLSLPTGSITETDGILQMDGTTVMDLRLPYSMQLGSGTVDLRPGLTYLQHGHEFSWGAQANAIVRLGSNAEDYSLGDAADASAWAGMRVGEAQSLSLRLRASYAGAIDGADPVIAPLAGMNPLADPANYGGKNAEIGIGWNWYADAESALAGQRFAVEFLLPVYQDLNGPQMESDWTLVVGWQYAF